jgi:hypothetical protein
MFFVLSRTVNPLGSRQKPSDESIWYARRFANANRKPDPKRSTVTAPSSLAKRVLNDKLNGVKNAARPKSTRRQVRTARRTPTIERGNIEHLRSLRNWARRICHGSAAKTNERREHQRIPLDLVPLITVFPLNAKSLEPVPNRRQRCFGKNQSETGISLIGRAGLDEQFFFAQQTSKSPVLLLRKIRQRVIGENVVEYGFQILDRRDQRLAKKQRSRSSPSRKPRAG